MKGELSKIIKKKIITIICIGLLFIVCILSSLPLPYFSKYIIDDVIYLEKYDKISEILCIFIFFIIINFVSSLYTNYLSVKFIQEIIYELKLLIYNKIFTGRTKFSNKDIGNSQIILTNDTNIVASGMYRLFWGISLNAILLLSYVIILININLNLFLINLILIPLLTILYIFIGKKIELKTIELQKNKDESSMIIYENYINAREIKVNDLLNFRFINLNKIFYSNKKLNIEQTVMIAILNLILGIVVTASPILVFIFGVKYVQNGELTIGNLISFISYQSLLFAPIRVIMDSYPNYKIIKASYVRLNNIFNLDYKRISCTKKMKDSIIFKNLSLETKYSFNFVIPNFILKSGDIVIISGSNGVGKSVFSNFLSGLFSDFNDIKGKYNLISELALITNESIVYGDTLKNNVFMGKNENINKLYELLRLVDLEYFIGRENEYLHSSSLSSGQIKKISIIRELYGEKNLYILDEVLSVIDENTRNKVINYCKNRKIALVIISHNIEIKEIEVKKYKLIKEKDNIILREE